MNPLSTRPVSRWLARMLRALLLTAALSFPAGSALAQGNAGAPLFVLQNGDNTLGTYDAVTGAAINAGFITAALSNPQGMVLSGNTLYVVNYGSNSVGTYDATTGASLNATFITGLQGPQGLALSGSHLFVGNFNNNTVGEYDAVTGSAVNTSVITGLSGPTGLTVAGGHLFVSSFSSNSIGEYDATNGAVINASFITGLGGPGEIAVSGNNLYVSNFSSGTVGKYDATTGAAIATSFITGVSGPTGLTVSGSILFVPSNSAGKIGEYNATTGATINASFITGLSGPVGVLAPPSGPAGHLPTATVGTMPSALAVDPISNLIYVLNQGENVSVLDGASFQVIDTLPASASGTVPAALAFNQVTQQLYVADASTGGLLAIDVRSRLSTPISSSAAVTAVAINPVTGTVYALLPGTNQLLVVNPSNFSTAQVALGAAPTSLAINPATNTIYVGTDALGVTVVNGTTLTVVHTASTDRIGAIATNPTTNLVYAIDTTTGGVQVIDGATTNILATLPVGPSLGTLALNPVTNQIYVSHLASNGVTVIDGLTRAVSLIDAGLTTNGVAVNPSTNQIYFTSAGEAHVAVLDGNTNQVSLLSTNGPSSAIGINPLTNRIYAAIPTTGQVSVLDGNTFHTTVIPGISTPKVITIDPSTNQIYVAGGKFQYHIEGDTLAVHFAGDASPKLDGAVDSATQKIYAISQGGNSLTQLDVPTGAVATATLSDTPFALALDSSLGRVYVAQHSTNPPKTTVLSSFNGIVPAGSLHLTGTPDFRFAVNPANHKIYALGTVGLWIIFDEFLHELEHTITGAVPVTFANGNGPFVAVNPVTNKIYMVLYGDGLNPGKVLVIDGTQDTQEAIVPVGAGPVSVAVNPVTNQVYVANSVSGSVTIIDGATDLPTEYVLGTGAHPVAVAVDPAGDRAYVASANGEVDIFARTVYLHSLTGLGKPSGLAVNPVTGKAYVLDRTGNQVIEIDPAPEAPSGLAAFISRLPGDSTVEPFANFTLGGVRAYSSAPVPGNSLFYQLDTMEGPWTSALSFGGPPFGFAQNLSFGYHTLYAFAADQSGVGSDPLGSVAATPISRIASYTFLVQPGSFTFSNPTVQVAASGGSVTLTVQRDFTDDATVNYQTVDGSALAGINYTPVQGTLSFSGGETVRTITIPVLNQPLGTVSGAFSLLLSNPSLGRVGTPGTANITVLNDLVSAGAVTLPAPTLIAPQAAPSAAGTIKVDLDLANGQWRLFGELAWRNGGTTARGLVAASYSVEYKPVSNATQPPTEIVVVTQGQPNVAISRMYNSMAPPQSGLLTVNFSPADTGGWRMQGETGFRPSGGTPLSLAIGSYILEFQPLTGRATPPSQVVTVLDSQLTAVNTTYLIADAPTGAVPVPITDQLTRTTMAPYEFLGQIQTDEGFGTGFVPYSRTVATAAHVLFDDGTLTYVTGVRWFFQHELGVFEAPPQIPRGTYLFAGYATQRAIDASPGVSTAASRQLDAAALYFLEPAGRGGSSGILASSSAASPWLLSHQPKLITGYPVDVPDPSTRGQLFATPSVPDALSYVSGALFRTNALTSYAGNSGGPLCVLYSDGNYYPAAIYLGGTDQTIVRSIDSQVVDLLQRAEATGQGGAIKAGGGIAHLNLGLTGNTALSLGSLRVNLGPAGAVSAGAGWHLASEANVRANGESALGLLPGTYTVNFSELTDYTTPPSATAIVTAGAETVVTGTYVPKSLPVITSPLLAQAIVGQSFSYQIAATVDPDTFTATHLPKGLQFNSTTGLLSGMLSASALAGSPYTIVLGAHNPLGNGPNSNLALQVVPAGQLTVSISGSGSVPVAFRNPSLRGVGSAVSITATPAPTNLFDSWRDAATGAVLSTQPLYQFTMPAQLSLQAVFVPNPFLARGGTYLALLPGPTYDLSGLLKVTATRTGGFTAAVTLGGSSRSITNLFDIHGHYEGGFALPTGRGFRLTLDLAPPSAPLLTLTGTVTDLATGTQLPLLALPAIAKAPPGIAGVYTAAFPLATLDPSLPGGTGFGRFTVSATGAVVFTGTLGADTRNPDKLVAHQTVMGSLIVGTPITVAGHLDSSGAWPFYLPPGKIPQTVLGTLTPNPGARPGFSGSLQWLRAPNAPDHLYPAGFAAFSLGFTSSRFTAPALAPTLNTQATLNADLTFTGGDLAGPLLHTITVSRAGKATDPTYTLTLNQATGLFSGTFPDPNQAAPVPFLGVILQDSATGAGFFSLPNGQTGAVLLQKEP